MWINGFRSRGQPVRPGQHGTADMPLLTMLLNVKLVAVPLAG
jgi:hypothetical protein